jgi:hypothetical protein
VIGGTKGLEAPTSLSISLNFAKAPFTCFRIHKKRDSGYTGLPYITEGPNLSKRSRECWLEMVDLWKGVRGVKSLEEMYIKIGILDMILKSPR